MTSQKLITVTYSFIVRGALIIYMYTSAGPCAGFHDSEGFEKKKIIK